MSSDARFFTGCGLVIATVVGVCIWASGGEDTRPPEEPTFMQSVTSVCDEHGNRLYSSGVSGSLTVAVQDPTCKEK